MSDSPVILAIGPGGRLGDVVQLRVTPDEVSELQGLLKDEGVYKGVVIQESVDVPDLAAVVASIAGGLGGVAAVMRVFFNRHQHRAVLMERDGTRIQLRGMSQEDMQGLIDQAVERARDDQLDSNRAHRDLPRLLDEDD